MEKTNELNKFLLTYEEFPGIYLIHQTTNLLMKLNDIEFLIDNYKFKVLIDRNKNKSIEIRIDAEVAYIFSDNYNLFDYKPILKKYIQEEISKLYNHCRTLGIDIFNINYRRYLKRMKPIDLNDLEIIYTLNLITP